MTARWSRLAARALPVRRAELPTFLLLAGVSLSFNLVDGLLDVLAVARFMGNVGVDGLPLLMLMEGLLFIVFSTFLTLLVDRWPRTRLLLGILVTYGLLLVGIRALIAWGGLPFAAYSLLYILRFLMSNLLLLIVAAMIGDAYSLAVAARLVPLFGTVALLGRIGGSKLGGESGRILVGYGLQPEDLLQFVAGFLGLGALAWWWLGHQHSRLFGLAGGAQQARSRAGPWDTLQQAPRFVREARIFAFLALATFASQIGFRIIGFEFLASSKSAYADNLGFQAFYGNVKALLQVGIFLLQLLVAGRLLQRAGAPVVLLAVPFHFLLGGLLILLQPGLWTGVILFAMNSVSFLVFERPSMDVLLTVVPQRLRGRVATLLKVFVTPAGWMVGGGLLLAIGLAQTGWSLGGAADALRGALLLACGLVALPTLLHLQRNYATYLLDWRLARRKRHIPNALLVFDAVAPPTAGRATRAGREESDERRAR